MSRLTLVIDDTLRAASTARATEESRTLSSHVRALMAEDAGIDDATAKRGRPAFPWLVVRTAFHGGGIVSRHRTREAADARRDTYASGGCTCGCAVVVAASEYNALRVTSDSPYAAARRGDDLV